MILSRCYYKSSFEMLYRTKEICLTVKSKHPVSAPLPSPCKAKSAMSYYAMSKMELIQLQASHIFKLTLFIMVLQYFPNICNNQYFQLVLSMKKITAYNYAIQYVLKL